MAARDHTVLELDGHEVRFSSPDKPFFPEEGITKLELCEYYLDVAEPLLAHLRDRPTSMKRFPDGATGEFFFQKRVPKHAPDWVEEMTVRFPSGRSANYLLCQDRAHIAWACNLGVCDWNPWPVRAPDGEHPDELRIDLDPTPESSDWPMVRQVALAVRDLLGELGLEGYPKTSGSRGIHIYVHCVREYDFYDIRRAALALAREIERRLPGRATSKWWKEERTGVFIDYNQNARDRTIASAYSVRPVPGALVSAPLAWDEVPDAEMGDFSLRTMPARVRERGDLSAGLHAREFSLAPLLEMADRDEAGGLGDAPWPPHFAKQRGEATRVAPSRARRPKG